MCSHGDGWLSDVTVVLLLLCAVLHVALITIPGSGPPGLPLSAHLCKLSGIAMLGGF